MATPVRRQSKDPYSPVASTAQPSLQSLLLNQRNHSFNRQLPRRDSAASSVLSFGNTQDGPDTIVEASPNAISSLLQPPIVRTGLNPHTTSSTNGFKAPTQRDIPPVALTNIPHIEPTVFQPYLSQVGSLYEAFQRAKNETETGDTALFHREKNDNKDAGWEAILNKKTQQRQPYSRRGSTSSSTPSIAEPPQLRRRSSAQKRTTAITPLSTVPPVYSEEDFHLENPRTFDIVSEKSEIVRDPNAAPSGRKSLATNAILQEKLSWYMDTVEVHLISSISTASKSFFSALGSLRELHAEAENSVARIQKLRRDLARLDKEMAVDGLKVVNLKQRRDNICRLAEAILQLEDIVKAAKQCEEMIQKGEIDGVLNNIDNVEQLMAGQRQSEKYVAQDLRRIRALEGALENLSYLRNQVGRGYESRFHGRLLEDIRRHVHETNTNATLQRWGTAFSRPRPGQKRTTLAPPNYINVAPEFRTELETDMKDLSRANHATPAVTSFRALVLREVKNIIRKNLPSSTDDDGVSVMSASTYGGRKLSQQEKSSILARNIRAMDNDDWYTMLVKTYTSVSESLRRLSVQVKILLDVTSAIDRPVSSSSSSSSVQSPQLRQGPDDGNRPMSPPSGGGGGGRPRSISIQAEMQQALDLSNLLGEAVDAAQNQLLKVLKVRSQQNSDMNIQEFVRYFTLNKLFADECEAISGRSGAALKTVVDVQIKDFISQFGGLQRQKLLEVMDADTWEARDFGGLESALLDHIIDGSTGYPAIWLETSAIWQPQIETDPPTALNGAGDVNGDPTPKVRTATIDEQKFILSDSPITMLRTLDRFQHLATGIPGTGQDIATHLLDCLKLYNLRTSQLILGAEATRTAGLRNITTKHLALSSQGLSFLITLTPYIREFFRRHVPTTAATVTMSEFDKVKRLFQEHQHGIHEKLVDIMSGRAATHVKTMKGMDWEVEAKAGMKVSPYMETLTKETATLHRVLSKHLSEASVMSIMIPVFGSYRSQLEAAYRDVQLKSPGAKERLLADALHFDSRLSKLQGSDGLGSYIVEIVRSKPIVTASVAIVDANSNVDDASTGHSSVSNNTLSGNGQTRTSADDSLPATADAGPKAGDGLTVATDTNGP